MPDPADALSTRIANKRDDLIALTQELIRIPTLNPPGRTTANLRLPERACASVGFQPSDPRHWCPRRQRRLSALEHRCPA